MSWSGQQTELNISSGIVALQCLNPGSCCICIFLLHLDAGAHSGEASSIPCGSTATCSIYLRHSKAPLRSCQVCASPCLVFVGCVDFCTFKLLVSFSAYMRNDFHLCCLAQWIQTRLQRGEGKDIKKWKRHLGICTVDKQFLKRSLSFYCLPSLVTGIHSWSKFFRIKFLKSLWEV